MPASSCLQASQPQRSPLVSVADATRSFVASVPSGARCRLEVKVSSREGMLLLCAVEAALAEALPRIAAQELVWLNGAPAPGGHVLRLQAYGPDNTLLAEAVHEFSA
jgi:hypothetical protein